jgi:secreted effector protein SseD
MNTVSVSAHMALAPLQDQPPARLGAQGNAFTQINELMMLMKKLNIEMRDTLREFHDEMQKVAVEKQMTSLETKQKGIAHAYSASIISGAMQIVSGIANTAGSLTGGVGGTFNKTGMSSVAPGIAAGIGKFAEGAGALRSAYENTEAQQLQLQGEFQANTADNLLKTLATTAERAAEASRQLREASRELLGLYERLANAVQMRAR